MSEIDELKKWKGRFVRVKKVDEGEPSALGVVVDVTKTLFGEETRLEVAPLSPDSVTRFSPTFSCGEDAVEELTRVQAIILAHQDVERHVNAYISKWEKKLRSVIGDDFNLPQGQLKHF